ncbi:hypothetical protein SRABI128_05622 [Microbacterium sp. Bi128]|nr:hypothetical protein SRABI128_05622 [Microbacterium sp. Bi128]
MRSGEDEGATRNTRSRPYLSEAAIHSAASSGMRSGVMSPAPPASARRRENSSTPIRTTGFQYVMTSTAASVLLVMPRTTSKTSRTWKPFARASVVAAWMTWPSMTGSEYGMPISMRSAPFSARAMPAAMVSLTLG